MLSIQQAKQFGMLDKMKLVVPYQMPFLAREVGGDLMAGVYAATDFWWTIEDKYPLAKMFVEAFEKKYGYKPEWGANNAYMQFALLGAHGRGGRHLLSAGRHQGLREGRRSSRRRSARCISDRRPPVRPPRHHRQGQDAKDMKGKEDYYDVVEIVPGEALMQKPDAFGCNLGDYT